LRLPDRFVALLDLRSRSRSSGGAKLLGAAIALCIIAVAVAMGDLPARDDIRPAWIPVAAACAVATIVANSIEFRMMGTFVGSTIGFVPALRVSTMSSAANILPIPGAALVKIQALRREAVGLGPATAATVGVGLIWVGTGFLLTALLAFAAGRVGFGLSTAAGAAASLGAGYLLVPKVSNRHWRDVSLLVVFEIAATGLTILRLFATLGALGGSSWTQAAALALTGIISTAVAIFPGGLGVREALSAGIAGFVDLDPGLAVVVVALDRVISLAVLAAMAGAVAANARRQAVPVESP
jgi:uncharacterized membrane protein YbhN (UPF0104 family)